MDILRKRVKTHHKDEELEARAMDDGQQHLPQFDITQADLVTTVQTIIKAKDFAVQDRELDEAINRVFASFIKQEKKLSPREFANMVCRSFSSRWTDNVVAIVAEYFCDYFINAAAKLDASDVRSVRDCLQTEDKIAAKVQERDAADKSKPAYLRLENEVASLARDLAIIKSSQGANEAIICFYELVGSVAEGFFRKGDAASFLQQKSKLMHAVVSQLKGMLERVVQEKQIVEKQIGAVAMDVDFLANFESMAIAESVKGNLGSGKEKSQRKRFLDDELDVEEVEEANESKPEDMAMEAAADEPKLNLATTAAFEPRHDRRDKRKAKTHRDSDSDCSDEEKEPPVTTHNVAHKKLKTGPRMGEYNIDS